MNWTIFNPRRRRKKKDKEKPPLAKVIGELVSMRFHNTAKSFWIVGLSALTVASSVISWQIEKPNPCIMLSSVKNKPRCEHGHALSLLTLPVSRMLYISLLVTGRLVKHIQSAYTEKCWLATSPPPPPPGSPYSPGATCDFSCKQFADISLAQGGSVWRATRLPGTTLLHINRPYEYKLGRADFGSNWDTFLSLWIRASWKISY